MWLDELHWYVFPYMYQKSPTILTLKSTSQLQQWPKYNSIFTISKNLFSLKDERYITELFNTFIDFIGSENLSRDFNNRKQLIQCSNKQLFVPRMLQTFVLPGIFQKIDTNLSLLCANLLCIYLLGTQCKSNFTYTFRTTFGNVIAPTSTLGTLPKAGISAADSLDINPPGSLDKQSLFAFLCSS
jgi:hypothetical protein